LIAEEGTDFASTRQSQQAPAGKTQVMGERLVRSLDDVEMTHRGPLQPGSIIKQRFVLDTLIGKGGMGLVFSAIDRRKEEAKDPNPRVAFKVLNADFQRHPQSFMALQREARKAQSLAHPNVVTVFDFDRDGDAVYMTMELLTGKPLENIVREARGKGIDRKIALPMIRGIAEGLAYAHRKGIVHSDLKPGNVFIGTDDTPKILDFGIARAVPSMNAEASQDVFDAGSLGAYTEAYATDEMVDGVDPHPADDMYALGIIGYELLTGFHPYQRHSAPNARKMGIKPPPLKGLKLREQRALERCLSLDRKQRPKDAGEFLKMFRGVTALQKATLAATAVLAIASGYLWYQNYLETSPAIPFEQLPAETQAEFTKSMKEGDEEFAFYRRESNPEMLNSAVEHYSAAYAAHPRNRAAVKALNQTADALFKSVSAIPGARKEVAEFLQRESDYYKKYQPVVDAAK
jgi:serine/threonine protein kinase